MRRAIVLLVAWCGAFLLLGSASAAPLRDAKKISKIVYAYADCVVAHRHKFAAKYILQDISNSDILARHSSLVDNDCLDGGADSAVTATFAGDLYRYLIAGALVRRELANRTLDDLDTVPLLDRDVVTRYLSPETGNKISKPRQDRDSTAYTESSWGSVVSRYGECVVRTDPAGAKAVLFSNPAEADEAAAFKALIPAMQGCLPAGNTVAFGATVLRGTLAVNYYRLSYAPRTAAKSMKATN